MIQSLLHTFFLTRVTMPTPPATTAARNARGLSICLCLPAKPLLLESALTKTAQALKRIGCILLLGCQAVEEMRSLRVDTVAESSEPLTWLCHRWRRRSRRGTCDHACQSGYLQGSGLSSNPAGTENQAAALHHSEMWCLGLMCLLVKSSRS